MLWRGLGINYAGGVLDHPARVAIHFTHRLGALLATILLLLAAFAALRGLGRGPRWAALAVLAALAVQISIGVFMVLRAFPLRARGRTQRRRRAAGGVHRVAEPQAPAGRRIFAERIRLNSAPQPAAPSLATPEPVVARSRTARWRSFYELTKPRVVMLIVFTSIVGTLLAVPGLPPLDALMFGNLGVGLAAASAAVINHVLDERIDAQMSRTKRRPLPTGKMSARAALLFAVVLCVLSMTILVLLVNTLTAVLTFASLIGYAVVYTVWLKRATSQNIVIGGAAGAAPPVLGWAAVTNSHRPERAAAVPHRVRVDAAAFLGAGDRAQGRIRQGGHSDAAGHAWRRVHAPAGAAVHRAADGGDAHAVRHRHERAHLPGRRAGAQRHVHLLRAADEAAPSARTCR